jgi:hypothetical protein
MLGRQTAHIGHECHSAALEPSVRKTRPEGRAKRVGHIRPIFPIRSSPWCPREVCRSKCDALDDCVCEPPATLGRLEDLLSAATEGGETAEREHSVPQQLKMDPGRAGLDNVLAEISKLQQFRQLKLPQDLFRHAAPRLLQRIGNAPPCRMLSRVRVE